MTSDGIDWTVDSLVIGTITRATRFLKQCHRCLLYHWDLVKKHRRQWLSARLMLPKCLKRLSKRNPHNGFLKLKNAFWSLCPSRPPYTLTQAVILHQNCNNYKYLQELISISLVPAPSFLNRTIREENWIMFMDNELYVYLCTYKPMPKSSGKGF